MNSTDAMRVLMRNPERTGIFCDFDGTLADIVPLPADAWPVLGATDVLAQLADSFRIVAIVSGRGLEDLRPRVDADGVVLAGSYGRERSDKELTQTAVAWGWEGVVQKAVARTTALHGVLVEPKEAGVALHYRSAPEHRDQIREIASDLAREFGLQIRPGRLVFELVVPGPGKAEAVVTLAGECGLDALLVAGDDAADVEAFEAVRSLDLEAVVVGIASSEAPPGLAAASDIVLPDPSAFVEFLRELASAGD